MRKLKLREVLSLAQGHSASDLMAYSPNLGDSDQKMDSDLDGGVGPSWESVSLPLSPVVKGGGETCPQGVSGRVKVYALNLVQGPLGYMAGLWRRGQVIPRKPWGAEVSQSS